jgi:glyoxylase-like metal-dependent hydrolase (beta-lactamase superfamily II)
VAQEAFGRIEEIGDGLWALISTPLTGDYTTLSNGGIIRGRDGVVVIEGLASADGARWMAERARELTGRHPTHVVVTHYHGDHSRGLDGLFADGVPVVHVTADTRRRVLDGFDPAAEPDRARPWADVNVIGENAARDIDIGGRTVRLTPRAGHTASDVMITLEEEPVTWCGDLVWNGMFPNYVDATPSVLSQTVRTIRASGHTTLVPGHGPMAGLGDLEIYEAMLDDVEDAAGRALAAGVSAEVAGGEYRLPADVAGWTLFNTGYFARAIDAWMRELSGEGPILSRPGF